MCLEANVTEDNRAYFGIGLSGIKCQLCIYRLRDLELVTESIFALFFCQMGTIIVDSVY